MKIAVKVSLLESTPRVLLRDETNGSSFTGLPDGTQGPQVHTDQQIIALIIRNKLGLQEEGFRVERFLSAADMLSRLDEEDQVECILLALNEHAHGAVELQGLLERGVALPIIIMVRDTDLESVVRVLCHDAVDVQRKSMQSDEILTALERVAHRLQLEHSSRKRARQRFAMLTPRERQVCMELSKGRLNKQIASDLGISEKTVKYHRGQIMRKLRLSSIPDLVRLVDQLGPILREGGRAETRGAVGDDVEI